jgi:hypothetical protein
VWKGQHVVSISSERLQQLIDEHGVLKSQPAFCRPECLLD